MKRFFLILVVLSILFAGLCASQIVIDRMHTPVWKTINDSHGLSNLADIVLKGDKLEIVDEKVSYYFVEVMTVSKHVGKKYWISAWNKDGKQLVIEKEGKFYIAQQGVMGRTEPRKVKETEGKVILPGSEVRILDKVVQKVKVNLCTGCQGWIFASNGKITE